MYRLSLFDRCCERYYSINEIRRMTMLWTQFVIIIVILISIQYTLNKILVEIKRIRTESYSEQELKK